MDEMKDCQLTRSNPRPPPPPPHLPPTKKIADLIWESAVPWADPDDGDVVEAGRVGDRGRWEVALLRLRHDDGVNLKTNFGPNELKLIFKLLYDKKLSST